MKYDIGTIATLIVSSLFAPWLSNHLGLTLTSDQQVSLAGGIVVFLTGLAHVVEAHIKRPSVPGLPPPAPGTVKLHWVTMVLVIALTMALLSACTTMQKVFAPSAAPYVTAAVDVAVAAAEVKGVPAVQINRIAKIALAADAGAGASLAAITTLVNTEIAQLKLPAADLAAVQILEVALTGAVQQQIGQNPNVAVAQADVAQVLNAVIAATGG